MRGLCNGLGPALFGLVFWLSDVHLSGEGQTAGVEQSFNSAAAGATNQPDSTNTTAAASTVAPAYEVEQNPVSQILIKIYLVSKAMLVICHCSPSTA